jgi:uncharacterized protein (TIGR01777 family)
LSLFQFQIQESAMNKRIILAGGSGFLGSVLATHFKKAGYEIVILTRWPRNRSDGIREVVWDAHTLGNWAHELEGSTAVVNLTGRSVDCRYNGKNRKEILESRVFSTRVVGEAIARCKEPPRVWLNASTATIYKHSFDRAMDEAGEIGVTPEAKDEFSITVARAWEKAFEEAQTPATRKVTLRSAMVLGLGANSVFPMLRRLARFGLGGKMASGKQFVSWIHAEDFCRAIEWLIQRDDLGGVVNLAAPNPIPNAEMMGIFRRVCGLPFGLPAAQWMLEVGALFLRTETELIIKSRRVVPARLLKEGFQFRFLHMEDAVKEIENRLAGRDQKSEAVYERPNPKCGLGNE